MITSLIVPEQDPELVGEETPYADEPVGEETISADEAVGEETISADETVGEETISADESVGEGDRVPLDDLMWPLECTHDKIKVLYRVHQKK